MSSDASSDDPALDSDASNDGEGDIINYANHDGTIASLAAAGLYTSPVGVAAGMAIASGSKKRKKHSFETDPSIRKRQQTRLLNRLKATIDEYTTRVGQQAIVLIVKPQKSQNNFKVFGAKPLENVVRSCKQLIMNEFENIIAQSAPPPAKGDSTKHELPPLVVDGIPTPVEKMTQAQLRAFIPLMLKYSTGRGKPGWGKDSTKPPWWPEGLPWANVRSDARSEDDKLKFSWTHALRQIVSNCYEYHGRQDLLPSCSEYDEKTRINSSNSSNNNNVNSNNSAGQQNSSLKDDKIIYTAQSLQHYAPTVVQTIQNPDGTISLANADGTLSLVQIDPNMHVITMPDGTQAQAVLILDAPQEQQQQM